VKDYTVIVPDLRGMGLSSDQDGGYEKTAQARDLAGILDKLEFKMLLSSPTTSATWLATPWRRWRRCV
jgi:pimeloyl-ACP methyl ester carboxylesterase